jgi:hypothetical protein
VALGVVARGGLPERMTVDFELLLFSTDPVFVAEAVRAGVAGVVVDWERIGKHRRQDSWDTQINGDTAEDLRRVRAATDVRVLCRINGFGETTVAEIEEAIGAGADEILLPMVRSVDQVRTVLELVGGRADLGILVETVDAVYLAEQLGALPLRRVYVGLNDLAIDRNSANVFSAVVDGTVERVRRGVPVPFGFAGLTRPDGGDPIPCRLLIGEMARLRCRFTFLRRSFHRDLRGRQVAVEVPRILESLREAARRTPEEVARDHEELAARVAAWRPRPGSGQPAALSQAVRG